MGPCQEETVRENLGLCLRGVKHTCPSRGSCGRHGAISCNRPDRPHHSGPKLPDVMLGLQIALSGLCVSREKLEHVSRPMRTEEISATSYRSIGVHLACQIIISLNPITSLRNF
jgi:hypothetical protein